MKFLFVFTAILVGLIDSIYGQNVVIHEQHVTYEFNSEKHATVTDKYKMTIYNEKGAYFANFYDYFDKFKKITSFKMTLTDSNGELVKKYTSNDAVDVNFSQSYEVDDSRMFILRPEYKIYPFTIEVEVVSSYNGFLWFPTWIPQQYFGVEVEESSLIIKTREGVKVRTFEEGPVHIVKNEVDIKGVNTRVWTVNNLVEKSNDLKYAEFIKKTPKVLISPVYFTYDNHPGSLESWVTFGDWFYALNEGRDGLTSKTKEKLDFISMSSTSERELIRWVYEYMQERTRYVSIQLGIGGFQTLESEFVDENGYGDCKALTNYMRSMLKYLNIESNYVLVKAGEDAINVVKEFPSNQFNHVILGVPMESDTIFLECTSQNQAFDYLGAFTADRDVLWIEKEKSKIIHSPIYGDDINKRLIKAKAEIQENGDMNVSFYSISTGSFYSDYQKIAHLSETQVLENSHNQFSYKDYSIINLDHDKMSSENPSFKTTASLNVRGLCKTISTRILIPNNILEPIDSYLIYDKYKKFGQVKNSIKLQEDIEMTFPKNYRLDDIPASFEVSNDIGKYQMFFEYDSKGSLSIKRKFKLEKSIYSQENFVQFDEFIKEIKSHERKVMVLREKSHQ